MIALLLLSMGLAYGVEVNDKLSLTLDGGEHVDGWFVRAEDGAVVLHVPELRRSAVIPITIVQSIECNQEKWSMDRFRLEMADAQRSYEALLADPPPHPHPAVVAFPNVLLAGSGHAVLGDWESAKGLMLLDTVAMGVATVEAFGQQRAQVFYSAALISLLIKGYSIADSVRLTQDRRRRFGKARQTFEKSGS